MTTKYTYLNTPFGPAYECKDPNCSEIFSARPDLPAGAVIAFHEVLKHEGPLPPHSGPSVFADFVEPLTSTRSIEIAKRMERAKCRDINPRLKQLLK
jgi:hypothetical protein